jgi:hypothetical protein
MLRDQRKAEAIGGPSSLSDLLCRFVTIGEIVLVAVAS